MLDGETKKIIIIKDVQSNFIEEMIVILKDVSRKVNKRDIVDIKYNCSNGQNNFIIKEAEKVLEDYINKNKIQKSELLNKQNTKNKKKVNLDLNKMLNYMIFMGIMGICIIFIKNIIF